MLGDIELQASLAYHEEIYNSAPHDMRIMLISSKAAILEVCGWVEQAMDEVVLETAQRCCLSQPRIKKISENYVKSTYGFSYKKHFEKMIISVVGYKILEIAETNASTPVALMESSLNYLEKLRNHYAHTHFDISNPYPDGLSSIPTPTVMRTHAKNAVDGLNAIEFQLKANSC